MTKRNEERDDIEAALRGEGHRQPSKRTLQRRRDEALRAQAEAVYTESLGDRYSNEVLGKISKRQVEAYLAKAFGNGASVILFDEGTGLSDYCVRKGTDEKWGIYLREYNVRVATFALNSHHIRILLERLFNQAAGVSYVPEDHERRGHAGRR